MTKNLWECKISARRLLADFVTNCKKREKMNTEH